MSSKFAHRSRTKVVKVANSAGKEVIVKQLRHKFLFGCSEFTVLPFVADEMEGQEARQAQKRYDHLTGLFNSVTLPFYWGSYEKQQGKPDATRMTAAAKYLRDKGIALKGHPLCWHTVCADWLLDMTNDEIYDTQIARIHRDVAAFAGLIDTWDVINEAVIMPIFDRYDNGITRICKERGRISLIKDLFATARAANPATTLLINDFHMSTSYDILIEGLLEAGVPIDAIGLQSHMHQGCWSMEKLEEILHRFSRFGLPLHFTEVTLVSGDIMPQHIVDLNDFAPDDWPSHAEGEARQATEATAFYDALFAHPLVEAITWWNFHDGLWLNAPSGILDRNSDPKPVYNALHGRIKGDWWTAEHRLVTNGNGEVTVTGIKGDYVAICDGQETAFVIE